MRADKVADHRRGLFLALESFAGTAALLLDKNTNLELGNRQSCDLLECADDGQLEAKWTVIAPLFGLRTHTPFSGKTRLCNAEIPLSIGTCPMSLELHALDEAAGQGYFALLRDRSVLDHLERELLQASERRGWGHQRVTLMHDLKGILNSMQISLDLIETTEEAVADVSPAQARKRKRMATAKEDLGRINRALRALPGMDAGADPPIIEFETCDVIRENLAMLRELVRANNIELELDLPVAPLTARGRRPWLKQALFNVIVHRMNAMRAGGRLVVEAAMTAQGAVVKLRNDEPDMCDDMVDAGHRPFCPGRGNGSTTDLQVARAIFESQGGAMDVESATNSTLFVLRLPAAPPSPPPRAERKF